MAGPRWYVTAEELPKKEGKYWVFPYRSLGGHLLVTMAQFEGGQWVGSSSRPQDYSHWKPIEVPDPPKVNIGRLIKRYE